jgi:hypothetical protein
VPRIFVFGSNTRGVHGLGAAAYAVKHHGAVYGQGEGLQGSSYGIPTKDRYIRTLPLEAIQIYVDRFMDFAKNNPDLEFDVTRVGCGLAGYSNGDMAPMFMNAPNNCWFPKAWEPWLGDVNYNDFE